MAGRGSEGRCGGGWASVARGESLGDRAWGTCPPPPPRHTRATQQAEGDALATTSPRALFRIALKMTCCEALSEKFTLSLSLHVIEGELDL